MGLRHPVLKIALLFIQAFQKFRIFQGLIFQLTWPTKGKNSRLNACVFCETQILDQKHTVSHGKNLDLLFVIQALRLSTQKTKLLPNPHVVCLIHTLLEHNDSYFGNRTIVLHSRLHSLRHTHTKLFVGYDVGFTQAEDHFRRFWWHTRLFWCSICLL